MAKHQQDILQSLLGNLSVRGILLHPATLFLFASIVTIGGSIQLWHSYQSRIVNSQEYQLTSENIHVTAPPTGQNDTSEADLKNIVLENASEEGQRPSLLQTELVSKTVSAFQTVGWVEQVRRVEKSTEGLNIDLIYRKPVGMVELNRLTIPGWPQSQTARLLPVDRQGVIMPGNLVAENDLLRFSIFNPNQFSQLDTWTNWPDDRVKTASEIAAFIGPRWKALGMYRIVTFRKSAAPNDHKIPFELWPDAGTQIVWGNAPGDEAEGEVSASKKLQAIEEFVANYGRLNELPKQRIDFRSGKPVSVSNFKTAELKSLIQDR